MRHKVSGRRLGRTTSHRKATMQNMAASLIARAKEDSLHNRRLAFDRLRNRDAVQKLFNDLGPRFKQRPGGYLRIMRCGFRAGDSAPMAYVELVQRAATAEAASA